MTLEEIEQLSEAEKIKIVNDWWTENYNQLEINIHKVLGYSIAAINKWKDDLMPYAYEVYRNMDLDKQVDIIYNGKPEFYITRGFALSIKSSTSMFYRQYRKFNSTSDEFTIRYHDQKWNEDWQRKESNDEIVQNALDKLNFYDRFLIQAYYFEGLNAYQIADKTTITASTVSKDIKKALKRLKIHLNDKIDFGE
jgi:RNA polymerase sigma factor (sigma-70 family)